MKMLTRISLLVFLIPFLVYGQWPYQYGTRFGTMTQFEQPPKIIQGPVVVGTGDSWAVIVWTTNAAGRGSSTVYAGTAKSTLEKVAQTAEPVKMSDVASYQEQQFTHLVRLNHLKPGTTYYFRVDSGMGYETGTSGIATLKTTSEHGATSWGATIY